MKLKKDRAITQEEETVYEPIKLIEFRNVSLTFPGQKEAVIKQINMTIGMEEKVTIVGAQESGKSILMKMLLGMYKPTTGNIYINGVNMNKLDKKQIRKQIAMVPEDVMLYNKSLYENLTLGEEDITEQEVFNATKRIDIHSYIDSLPDKYDTLITDFGMKMPVDKKQQIAIARTMVHPYSVVILDGVLDEMDEKHREEIVSYFMKQPGICFFLSHKGIVGNEDGAERKFLLQNGVMTEGK